MVPRAASWEQSLCCVGVAGVAEELAVDVIGLKEILELEVLLSGRKPLTIVLEDGYRLPIALFNNNCHYPCQSMSSQRMPFLVAAG